MFNFGGGRSPARLSTTPVGFPPLYFSASPTQAQNGTPDSPVTDSIPFPFSVRSPGKVSPLRGRTMKEYEEQLGQLKKENFSLKLRIYFLEERMGQKYDKEDKEELYKANIELKVETEALKRELCDKHDLVKQASAALTGLEQQFQEQIDSLKRQHQDEKESLEKKAEFLQKKLNENSEQCQEDGIRMGELTQLCGLAFNTPVETYPTEPGIDTLCQPDMAPAAFLNQDAPNPLGSSNGVISGEPQKRIAELEAKVEELEAKVQDLEDELTSKEATSLALEGDIANLKKELEDKTDKIIELEAEVVEKDLKVDQLMQDLETRHMEIEAKDSQIQTLHDDLNRVEPEIEVKVQEIVDRDRIIEKKTEQIQQQNKILVEIQITLDEKQKQIAELESSLYESEQKVKKLTEDFDKSCKAIELVAEEVKSRDKEIVSLKKELKRKEKKIRDLVAECKESLDMLRKAKWEAEISGGEDGIKEMVEEENERLWTELEQRKLEALAIRNEHEAALKEAQQQLAALKEAAVMTNEQLESLQKMQEENAKELAEREEKLREKCDEVIKLQQELQVLGSDLSHREDLLNSHQTLVVELKDKLSEAKEELKEKKEELLNVQQELRSRNSDLQNLANRELHERNKEIHQLQNRLTSSLNHKDTETLKTHFQINSNSTYPPNSQDQKEYWLIQPQNSDICYPATAGSRDSKETHADAVGSDLCRTSATSHPVHISVNSDSSSLQVLYHEVHRLQNEARSLKDERKELRDKLETLHKLNDQTSCENIRKTAGEEWNRQKNGHPQVPIKLDDDVEERQHEQVVSQLKGVVSNLKDELGCFKKKVSQQLTEMIEHKYQDTLKKYKQEVASLRKRLADSHNACDLLRTRLEELAEFMERILEMDEKGLIDLSSFSTKEMATLQRTLNESRALSHSLSQSLMIGVDSTLGESTAADEVMLCSTLNPLASWNHQRDDSLSAPLDSCDFNTSCRQDQPSVLTDETYHFDPTGDSRLYMSYNTSYPTSGSRITNELDVDIRELDNIADKVDVLVNKLENLPKDTLKTTKFAEQKNALTEQVDGEKHKEVSKNTEGPFHNLEEPCNGKQDEQIRRIMAVSGHLPDMKDNKVNQPVGYSVDSIVLASEFAESNCAVDGYPSPPVNCENSAQAVQTATPPKTVFSKTYDGMKSEITKVPENLWLLPNEHSSCSVELVPQCSEVKQTADSLLDGHAHDVHSHADAKLLPESVKTHVAGDSVPLKTSAFSLLDSQNCHASAVFSSGGLGSFSSCSRHQHVIPRNSEDVQVISEQLSTCPEMVNSSPFDRLFLADKPVANMSPHMQSADNSGVTTCSLSLVPYDLQSDPVPASQQAVPGRSTDSQCTVEFSKNKDSLVESIGQKSELTGCLNPLQGVHEESLTPKNEDSMESASATSQELLNLYLSSCSDTLPPPPHLMDSVINSDLKSQQISQEVELYQNISGNGSAIFNVSSADVVRTHCTGSKPLQQFTFFPSSRREQIMQYGEMRNPASLSAGGTVEHAPVWTLMSPSESEAWSEPDRNVSLARIGLDASALAATVDRSTSRSHQAHTSAFSSESDCEVVIEETGGASGGGGTMGSKILKRRSEAAEIRKLTAKLRAVEQLNEALHAELHIYQNLSQHIVTPQQQKHSKQQKHTSRSRTRDKSAETSRNETTDMAVMAGEETTPLMALVPTSLMEEIRALRLKLEEAIANNDHLRDQLEAALINHHSEDTKFHQLTLSLQHAQEQVHATHEKLTAAEKAHIDQCTAAELKIQEKNNQLMALSDRHEELKTQLAALQTKVNLSHKLVAEKDNLLKDQAKLFSSVKDCSATCDTKLSEQAIAFSKLCESFASLQQQADVFQPDKLVEKLKDALQASESHLLQITKERLSLVSECSRLRAQLASASAEALLIKGPSSGDESGPSVHKDLGVVKLLQDKLAELQKEKDELIREKQQLEENCEKLQAELIQVHNEDKQDITIKMNEDSVTLTALQLAHRKLQHSHALLQKDAGQLHEEVAVLRQEQRDVQRLKNDLEMKDSAVQQLTAQLESERRLTLNLQLQLGKVQLQDSTSPTTDTLHEVSDLASPASVTSIEFFRPSDGETRTAQLTRPTSLPSLKEKSQRSYKRKESSRRAMSWNENKENMPSPVASYAAVSNATAVPWRSQPPVTVVGTIPRIQALEVGVEEQESATTSGESPDLGIGSDCHFSSLERVPRLLPFRTSGQQACLPVLCSDASHSCLKEENRQLREEHEALSKELSQTKDSLEKAVDSLAKANERKETVERAICKQLTKTHHVLKQAKGNLKNSKASRSK